MGTEFEFEFNIVGKSDVRKRFSFLNRNIGNLSPAFEKIKERFYSGMDKQFKSLGTWGGHGWKPLSKKYSAWKERSTFQGRPLMVLSGALKKSLTQSGSPDNVEVLGVDSMVIGSSNIIGSWHQEGKESLPIRHVVVIPEKERNIWEDIIQDHIWKNNRN